MQRASAILLQMKICFSVLGLPWLLLLSACTTSPYPEVSHDGLIRVEKAKADAVYLLPGADLSTYSKITLLEPQIAFRSGWQQAINSGRTVDRISDDDMVRMIETGKPLLIEEFTKELEKNGFAVVDEAGPGILAVKPAIIDLEMTAPDPNNTAGVWVETYASGTGEATLQLELFDSVTGQLLVRAFDRKDDRNDGFGWRIPRTQVSNIQSARRAFADWARMLAKGLQQAKSSRTPEAGT